MLTAAGAAAILAEERRPNILLVAADDVGWSDLGCRGEIDPFSA